MLVQQQVKTMVYTPPFPHLQQALLFKPRYLVPLAIVAVGHWQEEIGQVILEGTLLLPELLLLLI